MGALLKILKSRFFLVMLSIAFLLSIVPTVLTVMGQGSYVRAAVQTVAQPFQWCASKVGSGVSGYLLYFRSLKSLREENAALKAELAQKNNDIYNAQLIAEENNFLRSYLGMKAEHGNFSFADATVIGRESTNYRTVYTLSRGTLHGVNTGMPVVTDDGLVGYIIECGETWSRAVAVTETSAAVGAYVERSGVLGVVEGTFELRSEGMCLMTYLESDADIMPGDKVLTSGVGSLYPRGLSIGEVVSVDYDRYSRTYQAKIKPYVSLDGLTKVMVVTEYEIIAE